MKFYILNLYGAIYTKKKMLRVMKLTIVFMIAAIMHVSALGFSQNKITLSVNNASLEKVLKAVRKQSGYNVFYILNEIKNAKPVSVNLNQASLEETLTLIFKNQPLQYAIEDRTVMIRKNEPPMQAKEQAPLINISGRVLDENGEGLPSVNVKVKGTTILVATNAEGRFTLTNIDENAIIVFSYIGYQPQEIKAAKTMIVKLLMQSSTLNDLVIVGYGTQKKGNVTSSVSQITRKDIASTPGASLQNMLTGKVTGLTTLQRTGQPGNDAAQIFVRGVSTLGGFNTAPLILVDDIPYEASQFARIDQNEIDQISILKDAASTAIYGIRGANGVILVTTRRGRLGKPIINLRTEMGANIAVKPFSPLNSYDAGILRNEALKNDGLPLQFTQEDLDLFKSGADPIGHPDINWYKELYRKSSIQNDNNIDISGGTDRVKYFTSIGYLYQNGLFKDIPYKGAMPLPDASEIDNNYFFKRYKFRSNVDVDATKSLKFSLNLTGTYAETNSPTVGGLGMQMVHYEYANQYAYPLYNPDGSFGYANPAVFQPRDGLNNLAAISSLSGYSREFNNFISANFSANQKLDRITRGLSVKGVFSYSMNNTATRSLSRGAIPSFYYNPANSTYTPKDITVFRIAPLSLGYSGNVNNSAGLGITPNRIMTYQGQVNYVRTFGSHAVSALALFNRSSTTSGAIAPQNFLGYTFRAGYNYKERYIIEGSGAYNGSSNFTSQKRYTLFPAVSVGWNLANENFIANNLKFVDMFKFRGSWGLTGSDDVGGYQYGYESFYGSGSAYNFGETSNAFGGIIESQLGNNDVSWATERKTNLGLDFSFFRGKLSGTVEYFDNYRYNILINRSTIPSAYGVPIASLPPVNLGAVKNKGFEVELSHRSKIGNLGYNLKGNFSFAKNRIIYRDEPNPLYPWQKSTGLPVGTFKQYIWTGQFYTTEEVADTKVAKPAGVVKPGWLKYKDLDGNGIINNDDMAYTGNPNVPNTVIGLTIGFEYKGFSISGLLQSNLNAESSTGFDMAVPFKVQLQPLHQNRWTPETASTATFPALTTNFAGSYMNPNGNRSTFWSVSTNFLRLRSAEIAYQVPQNFTQKLGLSAVRIYANGYNLFTFSNFYKKYQYDPELADQTNSFVYPTTRLVNMGINVTFK